MTLKWTFSKWILIWSPMTSDVCLCCLQNKALKPVHTWYSWVIKSLRGQILIYSTDLLWSEGQEGSDDHTIIDSVDGQAFPKSYSTFFWFVAFLCIHSGSISIIVSLKCVTFIFHAAELTLYSFFSKLSSRLKVQYKSTSVITQWHSILDILSSL